MARRKIVRRRRTQSPPRQSSAWLIFGLLIGLGVAAVMNWESVQKYIARATVDQEEKVVSVAAASKKQEKKKENEKPKKESKDPEFDFYNMLTNKEIESSQQVVLGERDREKAETAAVENAPDLPPVASPALKPESQASVDATQHYVIQLASFTDYQEADRLRAELTMSGFDVHIQSAEQNGKTWHRINMGPYASKKVALEKQAELQRQNISSVLIGGASKN